MMPVSEVLGQPLEVMHVFSEVDRDVRFQHLEDTALASSGVRISPGKAHERTHTGFRENLRRDCDGEALELRSKILLDNGADVFWLDVANAVLQLGQRFAQSGPEMMISRYDLAQFLQARHLGNEPQQADFSGRSDGKFNLLEKFRS